MVSLAQPGALSPAPGRRAHRERPRVASSQRRGAPAGRPEPTSREFHRRRPLRRLGHRRGGRQWGLHPTLPPRGEIHLHLSRRRRGENFVAGDGGRTRGAIFSRGGTLEVQNRSQPGGPRRGSEPAHGRCVREGPEHGVKFLGRRRGRGRPERVVRPATRRRGGRNEGHVRSDVHPARVRPVSYTH